MQTELLEGLAANFATNEYRLLVIDSIMALYRTDYSGRGELSERQQVLGSFLRRATQMAEEFNLVVLMVGLSLPLSDLKANIGLRQTKSCQTPVLVLSSQELMVESQPVAISLLMLLPPDFCSARVVARNELPRSLILLVRIHKSFHQLFGCNLANFWRRLP